MHPAYSVILFTTASGAGYGLLFLLGLLRAFGLVTPDWWFGATSIFIALALVTIGLVASTFHLGHPERAWRAFSQWRSSWLSREGLLSLSVFLPAGILGIAWLFFGQVLVWAGWLSAALAALTIYCTAMIYASLKPIPRWHNAWVPLNYLLLGLMTGALLLLSLLDLFARPAPLLAWLALLSIVLAALGKLG